jgi:hypothetical protein
MLLVTINPIEILITTNMAGVIGDRMEQRYCIVTDYYGRLCYIPVERTEQWYDLMDNDTEGLDSGVIPNWAVRIDSNFTFTDPRFE